MSACCPLARPKWCKLYLSGHCCRPAATNPLLDQTEALLEELTQLACEYDEVVRQNRELNRLVVLQAAKVEVSKCLTCFVQSSCQRLAPMCSSEESVLQALEGQLRVLSSSAHQQQAANTQLSCQVYSLQVQQTEQGAAASRNLSAAAALSAENARLQTQLGKMPLEQPAPEALIKAAHLPSTRWPAVDGAAAERGGQTPCTNGQDLG